MSQKTDWVGNLRPGDRFVWCDRSVTLQRAAPVYTKRHARWLYVTEDDGTEHRLHYYDDEQVFLADGVEVE